MRGFRFAVVGMAMAAAVTCLTVLACSATDAQWTPTVMQAAGTNEALLLTPSWSAAGGQWYNYSYNLTNRTSGEYIGAFELVFPWTVSMNWASGYFVPVHPQGWVAQVWPLPDYTIVGWMVEDWHQALGPGETKSYGFFTTYEPGTNKDVQTAALNYYAFAGMTFGPRQMFEAVPGVTERVSVSSSGEQANPEIWGPLSVSAHGRYVAFCSSADNLVPGDTNGYDDVFVRDRWAGTTERVSVSSSGEQGNGLVAYWGGPSISADGRYVAFESAASNLVPGDTNGYGDVFVRDRLARATERVSVSSSGEQGNWGSWWPSISADGRYVAFVSYASNLVPGDTNETLDVFVRDRWAGATERVSVSSSGEQGNRGSWWPSISADGRYVAFHSYASNLVSGDTNGYRDIFVRDRWGTGAPHTIPPTTPVRVVNPYTPPPTEPGKTLHRLKGQMHAHWYCDMWGSSTYRNWQTRYPHEVMETYRGLGYDFVCLTEHNHSTYSVASGSTFSLDFSSEVTTYSDPGPWYHLVAIGTENGTGRGENIPFQDTGPPRGSDRDPRWDDGLPWLEEVPFRSENGYQARQSTINNIVDMGGLAFIPHPDLLTYEWERWKPTKVKNFTYDQIKALGPRDSGDTTNKPASGIAVRTAASHEDALGLWDKLLRNQCGTWVDGKNLPLFGYAEDDYTPGVPSAASVAGATWVVAHAYYADGASVGVKREKVEDALRWGRFVSYWTNNSIPWEGSYPLLNIAVTTENNRPTILVSTYGGENLDSIKFIGKTGPWWSGVLHTATDTSYASYTCTGNETYVRIQCEYSKPWQPLKKLWIASQPFWVTPEGLVESQQGASASASIPSPGAGAQEETAEPIIAYVAPDDYPTVSPPQGYIGFVYNVTSSTGSVPAGATLTLSYAGEDVMAVGPDNLAVYYFNPAQGVWAALAIARNPEANTVSAGITQEGLYTISAELPADSAAPQVLITRPAEGGTVSGSTELACYAMDNVGVLRVQFYINDRQVGDDVDSGDGWKCEVETTPYVSGQYTLRVVAEDATGNWGEATKSFVITSPTPPPTVTIASHSGGETLSGTVSLSGACTDDEAVAEVWILVDGVLASPAEVQENVWTADVDLSLFAGGDRTISARAVDYYGNSAIASVRVNVDNPPTSTIGQARSAADGTFVNIGDSIVTAGTDQLEGVCYIQAADRSSGIRVVPAAAVVREGDLVRVAGVVQTVAGERQISSADVVIVRSANPAPRSLGMATRSLGGASGLNNIGLLVTAAGSVTQIGLDYLYVDDGSRLKDGTMTGDEENIGVRVICDPAGYSPGDFVLVTGISSCFKTPSRETARRILTRRAEDVRQVGE